MQNVDDTIHYELCRNFPQICGLDFRGKEDIFSKERYHHIKNKSKRTYRTIPKGVSTYELMDHLKGKTTVALPRFFQNESKRNSKMVVFDIDGRNHNGKQVCPQEIVQRVVLELGIEPFYLEYSKSSGGYHLYYRFNNFVNDTSLIKFVEYISEYEDIYSNSMRIEALTGDKIIRVPYSKQYQTAGVYDPYSINLINPVESFSELFDIFAESYYSKTNPSIPLVLKEWNTTRVFTNDSISPEIRKQYLQKIPSLIYGKGMRHETWLKIANYAYIAGISKPEFIQYAIELNDGTSSDMKKWSEREIEKRLSKLYDWIHEHPYLREVVDSHTLFLNKKETLSSSQKNDLSEVITYASFYLTDVSQIFGSKVHERKINDAIRAFKYLHQRQEYNISHGKGNTIKFGKYLTRLMGKALGIRSSEKIIGILVRSGLLTRLDNKTYTARGETKTNGWYNCRQGISTEYIVSDPSSILQWYYEVLPLHELNLIKNSVSINNGYVTLSVKDSFFSKLQTFVSIPKDFLWRVYHKIGSGWTAKTESKRKENHNRVSDFWKILFDYYPQYGWDSG